VVLQPAKCDSPWRADWLPTALLSVGALVDAGEPLAEFSNIKGLLHNAGDLEFPVLRLVDRGGVCCKDDDLALEAPLAKAMHQVEPGDADHHVVRNNEIEGDLRFLEHLQRFVSIGGELGVMPGELQDGGKRGTGAGLVIDDEDIQDSRGYLDGIDKPEKA